jgi:FKBP-type peptidyl-prolyl cis-trans isomerase SlyD
MHSRNRAGLDVGPYALALRFGHIRLAVTRVPRYQPRTRLGPSRSRAPHARHIMQIANDTAVFIHYTLKNDAGEVLDSSQGDEPLAYIHGHGNIVPGLERALSGKNPGDRFDIKVSPTDGYGERSDARVQDVPRSAFDSDTEIKPGMRFQAQGPSGSMIVTVTNVSPERVTVDANHPLAGENLNFAIEVVSVRECTQQELSHGHIHGADGHDH